MTMHRAKGREFTHVFAAGWEEGVFPLNPLALQAGSVTSEAKRSSQGGSERGDSGGGAGEVGMQADLDSAGSVEDERRLAYVTLTRAVGEVCFYFICNGQ
jgi:superfamily I DNA/RNA helicase